ncbi:MAG TPA: helicase HerA-like domain-containing protein, partial [Longimicrobiaceae bacterium]|nr:helicase HerA-like domain-containing protein [Longimicrobiaceae bacterium]
MNADVLAAARAAFPAAGDAVVLAAVEHENQVHPEPLVRVPLAMMNRHGLIAGATGTGKTKTLQLVAEQLSRAGVPVFLSDVKGDLSGIAEPGEPGERVSTRAAETGYAWQPAGSPVELLSLSGRSGAQLRATVSSFGPMLLSRVLDLNETQTSVLALVFKYCDDKGLLLLDFSDLRAVLQYLAGPGADELTEYGGMSKATVGVLLREMVELEQQGAEQFFGEPEFDLDALMRTTADGRGLVSVLELADVQDRPALSSTFMLWMLATLYGELPEMGDLEKPRLVFFFDEAHLLFTGASKAFLESVTQTVRLIRSKGVGIVFVTQNPTDVPSAVLGQLGNRVQHALRTFTPEDAKALRKTVSTFPESEDYDIAEMLTTLGTGEAAVTVLSERGSPTPVAWTMLRAPRSLMAPVDPAAMSDAVAASPLSGKYGQAVDRDSAYERLAARLAPPPAPAQTPEPELPNPWPEIPEPEPAPRRRRAQS